MEKHMKPLDGSIKEMYEKNPDLLAARKLIFAECVESHIKSLRKIISDEKRTEVETEQAYFNEWKRMQDLPFDKREMGFYTKWMKRFDVMYSYGMLPDVEDVYAQKNITL